MPYMTQWCKRHRRQDPKLTVIFCPACTVESVDQAESFRDALRQIAEYDDSGKWTDLSITLQHIAKQALKVNP